MTRPRFALLLGALVGALILSGCSDDDGGSDGALENIKTQVDGDALQATMPLFVTEVADDLGQISPPIFVDADNSLLGFVPAGIDPVEFCDRLGDFVAGEGFEGVPIHIVENLDSPEFLATGVAGGDCSGP